MTFLGYGDGIMDYFNGHFYINLTVKLLATFLPVKFTVNLWKKCKTLSERVVYMEAYKEV